MPEERRDERGQATVELVGLVVAVLTVGLLAVQGITVAQSASIAQEAARHGARALSQGHDWRAEVDRAVPDGIDVTRAEATLDDDAARVRVTVSVPLGLAGAPVVDVTLDREAVFAVGDRHGAA
ncbi:hypothetical protein UQW22_18620 [Isoptericola halotolerans]|uniref:TadE/TadG family type IV pilus assembly protein n=1 Tax=Isoptericola halotolerans TaxID=300560 RepID=UPI00388F8E4E